jgi:hypothetical protein
LAAFCTDGCGNRQQEDGREAAAEIQAGARPRHGERRGRSFTFSALIEKMRELLERGSVLDAVDVRATLPETGPHLTRTWTGYRWNRRAVYSTVTA